MTGYSPKDIANIDSNVLSVACGLQDILPPGRLNGFENMLKVIQEQISSFHSDTSLVISPDFSDIDSEYDIVDDSIMKVPVPSALKSFTASIDDKNSVSQQSIYYPDTVAVLLSGGVDSSVALSLLLQQGYKVKAFYLKIWLEDEIAHLNECPWEEDLQYAQSVCDLLNVTLETVSLQSEYWKEVVQYTLAEARLGRTPNPDVMCNSRIKFGMFYDYVGKYYYKVATGHYAQVRPKQQNTIEISESQSESEVELFCSPDLIKDQTYFLCNLRQDQLAKALFPIGHLAKSQVRVLAEQFNLPTKARKDSQGICFLGQLKFDDFIEFYLGKQPGEIRDYLTNEVIGEHNGLWFHTIGQRKGLGLLLFPGTIHMGPWFVASKDPTKNLLFVTNQLEVIPVYEY